MNKDLHILRGLLFAGGIYFLLISIAHMLGLKIPGLFIYFNVPSTAYQDRIISLLAFGWSVFFFTGAVNPDNSALVKAILVAGVGAVVGLSVINLVTDFNAYAPDIDVSIFWVETGLLVFYLATLVFFYWRSRHE